VRVVAGDAASSGGGAADVVVLDPPRAGARDALDAIVRRRPQRIVYVSCDTATLGRDVARLHALGYVPDAAIALDMFPQTAHLESVVRLVPAPAP
jgi:23S rRNA (uracil1939-C5)-methyltransferase